MLAVAFDKLPGVRLLPTFSVFCLLDDGNNDEDVILCNGDEVERGGGPGMFDDAIDAAALSSLLRGIGDCVGVRTPVPDSAAPLSTSVVMPTLANVIAGAEELLLPPLEDALPGGDAAALAGGLAEDAVGAVPALI